VLFSCVVESEHLRTMTATAPVTMVATKVSRNMSSKKDEDNTVLAAVPHTTRAATLALAQSMQHKTVAIIKNPHFQVVTMTTASGTVTLSAVGGAFGCMGGLIAGAMVGTVPALLTFGTSIPFGAIVGAGLGAPTGACMAGIAGGIAGGAAGHGVYVWRAEIRGGVLRFKIATAEKNKQARLALTTAKDSTLDRASKARTFALDQTHNARSYTTRKGKQVGSLAVSTKKRSSEVVADKRFQVTIASAAGGAVVGGTAGGAAGTVAGAGTGALVGLPAAIFTFGLSVPICATIGGGMGCFAGATSGGAVGGVAGGTAGYNAQKYQKEISGGAHSAWSKVRVKAADSVAQVRTLVSGTGGTGGTTGGVGSE